MPHHVALPTSSNVVQRPLKVAGQSMPTSCSSGSGYSESVSRDKARKTYGPRTVCDRHRLRSKPPSSVLCNARYLNQLLFCRIIDVLVWHADTGRGLLGVTPDTGESKVTLVGSPCSTPPLSLPVQHTPTILVVPPWLLQRNVMVRHAEAFSDTANRCSTRGGYAELANMAVPSLQCTTASKPKAECTEHDQKPPGPQVVVSTTGTVPLTQACMMFCCTETL